MQKLKNVVDTSELMFSKKVKTSKGEGVIDSLKITELGHVMLRVYFPKSKCFVNYTISNIVNLLEGSDLELIS